MMSLRTLLFCVAVVVFGFVAFVSSFGVAESPIPVWLPVLVGAVAGVIVTFVALFRSIDRDQRSLPAYESAPLNKVKPLLLVAAVIFFGMITVSMLLLLPGAFESESCSFSGDTISCTQSFSYFGFVWWLPFFAASLLAGLSSAAALVRDALGHRVSPARGH